MATSTHKGLYEILGISRDAKPDALRSAYRDLARQTHPDVNPGDPAAEARFKEISEAYAVLSNPERRRNYDEFGDLSLQAGFDPEQARRARESFGASFRSGGADWGNGGFAFGNLDDLIGNLFGRAGEQARGAPSAQWPMRGGDLDATLELDFLEAALGAEKRLTINRPTAEEGRRSETVTVRIPAGVADRGRIRIPGKGGEGLHGGQPGDLWAQIRVRPHPFFRRKGSNLYVDVPISVREATLGARVEVPTLEGKAFVRVPPGTDGGTRLRLRGKGVARPGSKGRGDLYVTVQIRVPRQVDDDGRAALETLARFDPKDLRENLDAQA